MERSFLIVKKERFKLMKRILFFFLVLQVFNPTMLLGQEQIVKGKVISGADNTAIPGVNVSIKGTTTGTVTDFDGNFAINAKPTDVLVISFIGFLTEEIEVGNRQLINVTLVEDVADLDEVVVIGYGVQKKKLNTGATVNVKGEDIQKLNTITPMDALKGNSAGVTITQNNGVPGSGTKVVIRGAGTIDHPEPLYIVDGVAVGDIDFLAPADIESIDVLKDAASAAIYGSRAANGVILVTTKKGSNKGKVSISYDFYHGWQSAYKKPELLNAQQYVEIMMEANSNSGRPDIDWAGMVPDWGNILNGTNTGVNWFDEIYNEGAPVSSHAINITGGSAKSSFALGFSTTKEEGILGKQANNVYERMNFRLNSEHIILELDGRSLLKIGENLTYSNFKKPTIRTGNIYWNDLHNMLVTSPLLPMYAEDETDPAYPYHYAINWNSTEVNPVAQMELNSKYSSNNNNSIVGNIYAEIEPINNLVLRTSYGVNAWFGTSRSWQPSYELGIRSSSARDQVDQSVWLGYTWTMTNTLAYKKSLANTHNLSAVLGQETQRNSMNVNVSGHNEGSTFQDWDHAYLYNVKVVDPTYTRVDGRDDFGWGLLSYFGRLSYDYNETLLATFVLRTDGSSRFADGNRWGTFPSASVGYVLSNHDFAKVIPGLNYLKLRGSWGRNGNENIGDFQYLSSLTYDNAEYFFGSDKTIRQSGAFLARVPNPDIKWETSEQTSIGFDVHFLNNKLQYNFDFYNKATKDWLVLAQNRGTDGTNPAYINGGDIQNRGVEMALRWKESRGDFSYGLSASFAYNKNEVTRIENGDEIIHGEANVLSQGTEEMYRAEVGFPIGYFYGYETNGILQNDAEVAAWVNAEGEPYFADAEPGDVRFVDLNNDGVIDNEDRKMIGDPNPDFVFGFQLNAEYKGIYMQVAANGQAGHQIAKSYRSFADSPKQNYTTDVYDRWHGEGTSNTQPRLLATGHRNYQLISDLYIEDADFLRINNITVGYDVNRLWKKSPLQQCRLYVSAKNILTITKYSGMDPEVGYGPDPWASGIDLGLYPSSKSYMIGVSAKF